MINLPHPVIGRDWILFVNSGLPLKTAAVSLEDAMIKTGAQKTVEGGRRNSWAAAVEAWELTVEEGEAGMAEGLWEESELGGRRQASSRCPARVTGTMIK